MIYSQLRWKKVKKKRKLDRTDKMNRKQFQDDILKPKHNSYHHKWINEWMYVYIFIFLYIGVCAYINNMCLYIYTYIHFKIYINYMHVYLKYIFLNKYITYMYIFKIYKINIYIFLYTNKYIHTLHTHAHTPIKRQTLSDWIEKQDPTICWGQHIVCKAYFL